MMRAMLFGFVSLVGCKSGSAKFEDKIVDGENEVV